MNPQHKRLAVLGLAVLLAVAGAAGPAFGALSYDSETTDSASTSDLTGGETVTDLDNESEVKRIQVISDNATSSSLTNPEEAFVLELTVNDSEHANDNRTFYSNDSTFDVVNASAGHYALNASHADMFAELERGVDENVSVDVTVTFNESESDAESSTISITAANTGDNVVDVITANEVESSSDSNVENESQYFGLASDHQFADVEKSHSINSNSTVTYVFADDNMSSVYTDAYDTADTSSGDWIYTMATHAGGSPIMVFDSEQGESRDAGWVASGFDTSEDTYGVYHDDGGEYGEHQRLEIVPQGDDADSSSLDVHSQGNKKLGFWTTLENFGIDDAMTAGTGEVPG